MCLYATFACVYCIVLSSPQLVTCHQMMLWQLRPEHRSGMANGKSFFGLKRLYRGFEGEGSPSPCVSLKFFNLRALKATMHPQSSSKIARSVHRSVCRSDSVFMPLHLSECKHANRWSETKFDNFLILKMRCYTPKFEWVSGVSVGQVFSRRNIHQMVDISRPYLIKVDPLIIAKSLTCLCTFLSELHCLRYWRSTYKQINARL